MRHLLFLRITSAAQEIVKGTNGCRDHPVTSTFPCQDAGQERYTGREMWYNPDIGFLPALAQDIRSCKQAFWAYLRRFSGHGGLPVTHPLEDGPPRAFPLFRMR